MKYHTIQYIHDLLTDHYNDLNTKVEEAKEQAREITLDSPPALIQEIRKKLEDARADQMDAEETLEDFNNHQWI